ncbi:hypothetical protein ONS95_004212 [Cadophora gregata]|uniref:uncharacterized protein n=1 Tax=Cadophora gregata TaxID=51156 RepID=UPI0026DBB099|nr:uncharacterized protein ONS95_004212 [Cadophora gregata]KAK0105685.1 hypothetical protein ONS95_004212 [Cadophora gregata]
MSHDILPVQTNSGNLSAGVIQLQHIGKNQEITLMDDENQSPCCKHDPSSSQMDAKPEPQQETPNPASRSRARAVLLVGSLACSCFLSVFNVQSVVILLPSISHDLNIPTQRQQMATSVYNIASGCLILLWGRLADVYGHRIIYLGSSTGFAIASIAMPFSPNEICFYPLRALQGMSGAATVSSAVGIMASTFPVGKSRNKAFVTFSAAASLGSILGNIAGGVIGGYLSWKWVFWIPSIPAVLITMIAFVLIPAPESPAQDARGSTRSSIDWIGAAMVSTALLLLLVGIAQANVVGWTAPWILTIVGVSLLLMVFFIFWQHHLEIDPQRQPLMRVSMFKDFQFSAMFIVIFCFYGSFNSFLIFATFFYQDYLGLGVLDTTLRFVPAGVTGRKNNHSFTRSLMY